MKKTAICIVIGVVVLFALGLFSVIFLPFV